MQFHLMKYSLMSNF